jgi:hypothetical protein
MPVWLLLLQACWVAAFVGLGCKLWILSIDMLDNLVPEAPSRAKFMFILRRTPYSEELNEKGQILRRHFFRLLLIFIALFLSGTIVLNLGKILA